MGEITYVFEGSPTEEVEELLNQIEKRSDMVVEEEDAEDWSDEEKWDFYMEKILPYSVVQSKKLRGRIRTHQSGTVSYDTEVLLMGDKLYLGEEEIKAALKEEVEATA